MNYITVSELKKSKDMWRMLDEERELVVTRDGKPGAIMIEVTPREVESTIKAIRRARFSEAREAIRERAEELGFPTEKEIEKIIQETRKARK